MEISLPSLELYRDNYLSRGIKAPLQTVPVASRGLLAQLPLPDTGKAGWPWTEETSPGIYGTKTDWPKITIVTPSYNQGQFIEGTIRSVLLQNYPNLEYIVIDGGSTDGTPKILKKYAPWISFWQSEPDNGQGQAINLGFSIASGSIHAWINSDDYYLQDVFFAAANVFSRTKADFVYGYGLNYYRDRDHFELIKIMPHTDYFIKMPTLIQPSTFWKSGIHQPIWEELHCSLDFELWLRLVRGRRRHLIKKPLSVAHVHGDAKTFNPEMGGKWEEDHLKIWDDEAHGRVHEWKKLVFLNRIRVRIYKILRLI